MKSDLLIGLDLGTKKVSIVVAERASEASGEARIIGIGEAAAKGMSKGKIINLQEAVASVRAAVDDIGELLPDVDISEACLSFSGQNILSYNLHGAVKLGEIPRPVSEGDIEEVVAQALSTQPLEGDWCFLHTIPVNYILDGHNEIENPRGMTGTALEVDVTALAVRASVIQNVINCVEKAGIAVTGLLVKPLAEAYGALDRDEILTNVSQISIGGGTTSLVIYYKGHPVLVQEFPVGGDHVTNDIVVIQRIPFPAAEKVKYEINLAPDASQGGTIKIHSRHGETLIERDELYNIISSRLDEIFRETILKRLQAVERVIPKTELIMSGGVFLTEGIREFAEKCLDRRIKIATPVLDSQMPPRKNDMRYTALVGLIRFIQMQEADRFSCLSVNLERFTGLARANLSRPGIKNIRSGVPVFKKIGDNIRRVFKEIF